MFVDELMTKIFKDDIECTELVLHIILDIYATDNEQKEYDIEIQRVDSGAKPKRARYHSSLLDANILLASDGEILAEISGLDIEVVETLEKEQKAAVY